MNRREFLSTTAVALVVRPAAPAWPAVVPAWVSFSVGGNGADLWDEADFPWQVGIWAGRSHLTMMEGGARAGRLSPGAGSRPTAGRSRP